MYKIYSILYVGYERLYGLLSVYLYEPEFYLKPLLIGQNYVSDAQGKKKLSLYHHIIKTKHFAWFCIKLYAGFPLELHIKSSMFTPIPTGRFQNSYLKCIISLLLVSLAGSLSPDCCVL